MLTNLSQITYVIGVARIGARMIDSKGSVLSPRGPDFEDSTCSEGRSISLALAVFFKVDLGLPTHPWF